MRRSQAALVALLAASTGAGRPASSLPATAAPQPDVIETTMFLVGDAGAPGEPRARVLDGLLTQAKAAPGRVVIVFLGDNAYPAGVSGESPEIRRDAEARLARQIDVVTGAQAQGIFVPGNHDWGTARDTGAYPIKRQGTFIAQYSKGKAQLLPENGCGDPGVVDIGEHVRLILLDTEWWVRQPLPFAAYGPIVTGATEVGAGPCAANSEADVVAALGVALKDAGTRKTVVAAHHPLVSGGPHGGHYGLREHIFPLVDFVPWLWVPLPFVGSAYPLARSMGISDEDINSPSYKRTRNAIDRALAVHPPLVYASGHDHTLQVLTGTSARYLLVSGAGSDGQADPAHRLPTTLYAGSTNGFMRLDVLTTGRVRVTVIATGSRGQPVERFSRWLD